jgi:hypothetical protein
MVPRPLVNPGLFVGAGTFPDHFRFNVFFGNSCFTNAFFDPFCQPFFFPNRYDRVAPHDQIANVKVV